jgi:hypothetical protein
MRTSQSIHLPSSTVRITKLPSGALRKRLPLIGSCGYCTACTPSHSNAKCCEEVDPKEYSDWANEVEASYGD